MLWCLALWRDPLSMATIRIVLLLALALGPCSVISMSGWNYDPDSPHGPAYWSGECQDGSRQSPIDISVRHTTPVRFDSFIFNNYNHLLNNNNVTLHSNGHTVVVDAGRGWRKSLPSVKGGGLEATYVLDHIHFHAGAEHTVNGKRYPLEAHLVHRERDTDSVREALSKRDGIAVLGVLFHLSKSPNKNLHALMETLRRLDNQGGKVMVNGPTMPLSTLVPTQTDQFFRYYGSLTTPDCHEAVVWTVFESTIGISEEQLKLFQAMPESNFRPTQNLNQRFILRNTPTEASWEHQKTSSAITSLPCSSILLPSLVVHLLYNSVTRWWLP